jgi:hypothetical protein
VATGTYTVVLTVAGTEHRQPVAVVPDPEDA